MKNFYMFHVEKFLLEAEGIIYKSILFKSNLSELALFFQSDRINDKLRFVENGQYHAVLHK